MAEDVDALNFIRDVPFQIEQARLAVTSNNINDLELWHMRLETSVNALVAIQDCLQRFPNLQNEHTEAFQNNLTTLAGQVLMARNDIEQILEEGVRLGDANRN